MKRILMIAAGALLSATAFAQGEQEISLDDVPADILATAEATAPGVEFYRVSIEIENGQKVYEFEATGPNGKHIEIDVLEDGTLDEIEMEKEISDLPDEVKTAVEERTPGFEPTYIEASIRPDGVFVYEIEGVDGEGVAVGFEVSESGEILSMDRVNIG